MFPFVVQLSSVLSSISQGLGTVIWIAFAWICLDKIFSFLWSLFQTTKIDLKGKHVLITGASKGIGKEVAKECVRRGANVSIVARNVQHLSEANHEISQCIAKTPPEEAGQQSRQKIQDISLDVTADFESVAESVR